MKRILSLLCLLCLTVVCVAQASELTGDQRSAVVTKLSSASKNLKGLKADFVQTRTSTMLAAPIESKGTLSFMAPDEVRWSYTSPQSTTLVIKGDNLSVVTGDGRERKSGNRMSKAMATMIRESFVGGSVFNERLFSSKIYDEGNTYRAELKPVRRDMQRMFQSVTVTFDKRNTLVQRLELQEKDGNATVIVFRNQKASR
ncbi:MAG: outer membrane lipoprotein carrier protein LolA [Bacteroidales bacterium]|nr:outer membrane lipoprotein carrier protein LolA [Bacteroidales bacterium]